MALSNEILPELRPTAPEGEGEWLRHCILLNGIRIGVATRWASRENARDPSDAPAQPELAARTARRVGAFQHGEASSRDC